MSLPEIVAKTGGVVAVGSSAVLGHSFKSELHERIWLLIILMCLQVASLMLVVWMIVRERRAQAKERRRQRECQEKAGQNQTQRNDNTNADMESGRRKCQERPAARSEGAH